MTQAGRRSARTRILFVRHAQSTGNVNGLFAGQSEFPLSGAGEEQARCVGAAVAGMVGNSPNIAVITSPSGRAKSTASAIAERLNVQNEPLDDERLAEMNYGDWEGRPFSEVASGFEIVRLFANPDFSPPNGESVNMLCERTERWVLEKADGEFDRTIVAVSHFGPIKAAAIWALGCDRSAFPKIRVDNASISRIDVRDSVGALASLNETHHLRCP